MEPLPPVKEVEYRCYISKMFEELSGSEFMTFGFETAKEFSSFRYEIAVRYRIQFDPEKRLEFKVLGMTATRTMMPAHGTARSVLKIPLLPYGIYEVKMIKSDGTENMFSIEVTRKGFQIVQPIPRKRFIDLVIEPKAAMPGAKHLSTVSKTPPAPLVPRTIQKRQPMPPTEEELALLESLKSETPEERDRREEMELFGGKKKVDKKELEESENELKKMGGTTGVTGTSKAGAKKPQDEVKEVPANMKHKTPTKPAAAKPAAAKATDAKSEAKATPKPAEKPAKHSATSTKAKPAAKKPAPKKAVPKPAKKKVTKKR